ncbi:MAG: hypothetical protein R3E14_13475 [Erythrobacter sp.]
MSNAIPPETGDFSPLEGIEGAIDWWREAGVDCDFAEDATDWLARPEAEDAVTAAPPPPPAPPPVRSPLERALDQEDRPAIGGPRADWPDSLEEFREWWMTEPSLGEGSLERRLPPRGVAGAKLLVLVGQPESDDTEGLMTGGAGRLLAAMLKAMGIAAHEAYFASALPASMAMPDWHELSRAGLGEIARHHIALARPQRLLAIGRSQLALFGIALEQAREPLAIECNGTMVPLLSAPDFSQIARSAARRERLWQRWLEWTA